jgi:hypothetical protein
MLGDLLRFVASRAFAPSKTVDLHHTDLSHTLLASAQAGGATWRYRTTRPDDTWTGLDYEDGAWKRGRAGFGRGVEDLATIRTRWNSADIWIRTIVEVGPEGIGQAIVRYFHNDDMEVWVNGKPLFTRDGFVREYEDAHLAPDQIALFRPGKNVICAHCHNVAGAQYIDLGITYEPAAPITTGAGLAPVSVNGNEATGTRNGNTAADPTTMAQHQEKHALQTTHR